MFLTWPKPLSWWGWKKYVHTECDGGLWGAAPKKALSSKWPKYRNTLPEWGDRLKLRGFSLSSRSLDILSLQNIQQMSLDAETLNWKTCVEGRVVVVGSVWARLYVPHFTRGTLNTLQPTAARQKPTSQHQRLVGFIKKSYRGSCLMSVQKKRVRDSDSPLIQRRGHHHDSFHSLEERIAGLLLLSLLRSHDTPQTYELPGWRATRLRTEQTPLHHNTIKSPFHQEIEHQRRNKSLPLSCLCPVYAQLSLSYGYIGIYWTAVLVPV